MISESANRRSTNRRSSDPWTIVLLTCRKPQTDFRFALARELMLTGNDVHYIFLKRRPTVQILESNFGTEEMSFPSFLRYMRKLSRSKPKLLVFNSTNLAFPGVTTLLKFIAGGVWCFDLHDDLLYEQTGWKRWRAAAAQKLLIWWSDFSVHAAPTLVELFPRSRHIGNASDVNAVQRDEFDVKNILILASLDGRFDFEFMARVAKTNPDLSFHIHGQISQGSLDAKIKLYSMLDDAPNIVYLGAYSNDFLPDILARYGITLAPYLTNSRLTRYIDPLRYYHCLNSGLELITTDIPAAQYLKNELHIIRDSEAFRPLLECLRQNQDLRRNFGLRRASHAWRDKAEALMTIMAVRCASSDGSVA